MLPWSVTARLSMPSFLTCATSSPTRFAPSRREYSLRLPAGHRESDSARRMMEEIGRPGRGTSVVLRPGEATGAWYDCQKPLCRLILIDPVTTGPLPESSASDPVSNLDPP